MVGNPCITLWMGVDFALLKVIMRDVLTGTFFVVLEMYLFMYSRVIEFSHDQLSESIENTDDYLSDQSKKLDSSLSFIVIFWDKITQSIFQIVNKVKIVSKIKIANF